ncbi:hypothetical protein MRV_0027 [Murid herpesvirus 3]|uniref:Uncharacterized protein n=2 Tax=Murid betaherpesvirus 3 TaxID=2560603 RepID=A0A1P8VIR6_9BETA|nr:hypothetical protein MRV_0027 [Murine roseolovirus]APZ76238.1 hypothetical protein MRV_0027 [Murid betaherpesvirus 3]AYH64811.1 hypothetical protein MRV_0027 [Murid herpesvirus 3]
MFRDKVSSTIKDILTLSIFKNNGQYNAVNREEDCSKDLSRCSNTTCGNKACSVLNIPVYVNSNDTRLGKNNGPCSGHTQKTCVKKNTSDKSMYLDDFTVDDWITGKLIYV